MDHRRFDQMRFQRRQLQVGAHEPKRKAYITTAEDIVRVKLEWYRLGGEVSDRQWRDILGVPKVQAGRIDPDYLRKGAAELCFSSPNPLGKQPINENETLRQT